MSLNPLETLLKPSRNTIFKLISKFALWQQMCKNNKQTNKNSIYRENNCWGNKLLTYLLLAETCLVSNHREQHSAKNTRQLYRTSFVCHCGLTLKTCLCVNNFQSKRKGNSWTTTRTSFKGSYLEIFFTIRRLPGWIM